MDQQQGGTPPVDFASDLEVLRGLLKRFCTRNSELAPHAMFGEMSNPERMRYTHLHFDHHLRQFGTLRSTDSAYGRFFPQPASLPVEVKRPVVGIRADLFLVPQSSGPTRRPAGAV